MATVTESVKESLLGSVKPENLTQDSRARFLAHATEEQDGEHYMTKDQFIDAIAPTEEDYVGRPSIHALDPICLTICSTR
jgi:solute carrier family 25 (mitochondrial aspartate/glutamate transporter), member 12/13